MHSFLKKENIHLILFFLSMATAILFRTAIESTHYCSPDSKQYLEVANNLLAGKGATSTIKVDQMITQSYFAIWPLGYPVTIVATSWISHLDTLWASKIVNIILLGISMLLLKRLFNPYAHLPIFYFGCYAMLEICTYTWSENLFIPLFLGYILSLKHIEQSDKIHIVHLALFIITLTGMCLTRYASVIYFVVSIIFACQYLQLRAYRKMVFMLAGILISALVIAAYLWNNFLQTGYITGMPRNNTQIFSIATLCYKFIIGMFNQLHLVKQCRFAGTNDFIFYLFLTFIQVILMAYTYIKLDHKTFKFFKKANKHLIISASTYLLFITTLTFFSTIDPFDYRTLMPFIFPLMIALFATIEENLAGQTQTIMLIKCFFVFAVLMNLPKQYIFEMVKQCF